MMAFMSCSGIEIVLSSCNQCSREHYMQAGRSEGAGSLSLPVHIYSINFLKDIAREQGHASPVSCSAIRYFF
jgi:hypothetical protein